jgi:hypothetical protein
MSRKRGRLSGKAIVVLAISMRRTEMKKWLSLGAAGCLLVCLSDCGKGAPTAPSYPLSPTVTAMGITVNSSGGSLFIGETEAFTATMTGPDGSPVAVAGGTWSSDTPSVATVNDAGLVTIVGQGWANISCALGGLLGSKQIWGRVDCRGTWSGTYNVRDCRLWQSFPDRLFCATHGGSGLPIELAVTQEGETLRGTLKWGGFSRPFIAMPELDGSVEMEGEVFSDPYWINIAVGCSWEGSAPKFCMMLYYRTSPDAPGQAMLYCDIFISKTGVGR